MQFNYICEITNLSLLVSLLLAALYLKIQTFNLPKSREVACGSTLYWRDQLRKKHEKIVNENESRQSNISSGRGSLIGSSFFQESFK